MSTNHSSLRSIVVAVFLLLTSLLSAQEKPNLVLLPIELSEQEQNLAEEYLASVAEGLKTRYTVFYGAEVEKLLEKEYEKIDCTVESCNQALAVAFNGELIADSSVKRISQGYLLKLKITNVLTSEIVETRTLPCEACNEFSLISKLKAMGAGTQSTVVRPEPKSRVKLLTSKPKEISADNRAILIFDSNPSGAELFLNNKKVGKTPYQGLNHYIGEQLNLKLVAPYHKSLEQSVELSKPINQLETFQLEAGRAFLQVASDPYVENTKVYVDGEEKGIAPLNLELTSGEHQIQIKSSITSKQSTTKTITL